MSRERKEGTCQEEWQIHQSQKETERRGRQKTMFKRDMERMLSKLNMQYRYGAIPPHIILTKSSGCKTELQDYCRAIMTMSTQEVPIDLVKTLGLINVSQRREYFMIILMFISIHGLVPNYLCDEITMQRDIATRTTRSTINNNVHVPHITLECCKNAFAYRGPVLWNALPENIKKFESLNGFKRCIKLHVVE